jgi:quercetin 2,3-dioxygenase
LKFTLLSLNINRLEVLMLTIRRANERGHANHGWLDSYHTFSFANYYDPAHMGFRSLRVINEDRVDSGRGFGTHPHRDMEIISYVLDGAIAHQDSMGNGSTIRPGDVQRMTAGTGVTHSEFNPSKSEAAHFLQIWVLPEQAGLAPSYEQKAFSQEDKQGQLRLIASRDGREGSVVVHQDLNLYATVLAETEQVSLDLNPDRHYWVQVAKGMANVNGELLMAGDAIGIHQETALSLVGKENAELLVFDLA